MGISHTFFMDSDRLTDFFTGVDCLSDDPPLANTENHALFCLDLR